MDVSLKMGFTYHFGVIPCDLTSCESNFIVIASVVTPILGRRWFRFLPLHCRFTCVNRPYVACMAVVTTTETTEG